MEFWCELMCNLYALTSSFFDDFIVLLVCRFVQSLAERANLIERLPSEQ